MLFGNSQRRAIAAALFLTFFTETFAPGISYALTAGPTSPEASSFEPVDTTDMVNLQTGTFTDNIPLIEVPGPDGGYPLSLAYHAGIQPNLDASWTGLGWDINPGAINRSVNGFPDDWANIKASNRVYWSGGNTTTYSAGVNIGISNSPFSVNFGLTVQQDTYKGFGVGFNAGIGISGETDEQDEAGKFVKTGMNTSIGISVAPYTGKTSLSYGVSQTAPVFAGIGISTGVNLSTNFKTVSGSAAGGIGVDGTNLLRASISSNGSSQYSYGFGGISKTFTNSKAPGVETSTKGLNLDFPICSGLSVSLGYSKTRYWTDETSSEYIAGSYYPLSGFPGSTAYDMYELLDDPTVLNIAAYPDPTVLQGGGFPDYDDYTVLGQGLSGMMRPFTYQQELLAQNHQDANNNPTVTSVNVSAGNFTHYGATSFRFISDFSNSYRQAYNQYASTTTQAALTSTLPPFDTNPQWGDGDGNYGASVNASLGQTISNPALAGSRHIDLGVQVLPTNCPGFGTPNRLSNGMFNGFSITNESGVTYHYGLPAYSYGEENYQEKISRANGLYFNRSTKTYPYAYTWYLTSITGPDYVDRNGDGHADVGDWGYWVNFEYGKWSNTYAWRNPSQGFTKDDDDNFQDCSQGYKEIYYLNAIRTRSNIAIFEKDLRQDGKGVTPLTFTKNQQNNQNGVLTNTDYVTYGGFDVNSSQSLQLSHIYLLNIGDSNFVTPASNTSTTIYTPNRTIPCSDCELPTNVIDANDVNTVGRSALEARALRIIDFNYDYSLCPNTANSFDALHSPGVLNGKLTLKSVTTRGKGGANLIPPTKFVYDLTGTDLVSQTGVTLTPAFAGAQAFFTTTNGNFYPGDLITTMGTPTTFCGAISQKSSPVNGVYTYTLANCPLIGTAMTLNIQTTKNPPYNKDFFDSWGLYKSDADLNLLAGNENMGRNTSPVSGRGSDAWCLRRVYAPLGDYIKINYESDTYHTSVMNNTYSYVMQNLLVAAGTGNQQITFTMATYGSTANPASLINMNQYLSTLILAVNYSGAGNACSGNLRVPITQPVIGGITIVGISTNTSTGVTTITGDLDHPIPATWFGGNFNGIASGNLWINSTSDFVGGGVRVNSITSNHAFDNTSSTISYNYNNPTTGYSSGVTSYLPTTLDAYDAVAMNNTNGQTYCELSDDINNYLAQLYKNVNSVYPISRELPPPGVMYQYVTVTNQEQNPDEASTRGIEGSTQYLFEVLQPGMVVRDELPALMAGSYKIGRNWVIRKFTSAIGNIKSITQFDNKGVPMGMTINHYLHDNLEAAGLTGDNFFTPYLALLQPPGPYNEQGFFQERFLDVKTVSATYQSPTAPHYLGASVYLGGNRAAFAGREDYPSIQTGQTVINYVNGSQTSTSNLVFDYYSGTVLETLTTDEYGNNVMTQNVPAYRQYGAMGLKIGNDFNKNMLSQTAETYKWKVDGNNNPLELISASATTWTDNMQSIDINGNPYTQNVPSTATTKTTVGDIWRPQSTYQYLPTTATADGLTPKASFTDFNFASPSASVAPWTNLSNFTLYDVYSKALEGDDVDGHYSATHMDYGDQKVVLTGTPTRFYEIAYSGAEDAGINQTGSNFVQGGGGTVTTAAAHTGAQSLLLGVSGVKGFTYSVPTASLTAGRTYLANVWVKPASGSSSTVGLYYDIDGAVKSSNSSSTSTKTANGWTLVSLIINGSDIVSGHTLDVWCRNDNTSVQAYVDDFRFQPVGAISTAYVYDPFSAELTYTLDNNDLFTNYVYDGVGRLTAIKKEKLGTGVYQKEGFQYNYGTYTNVAINNQPYVRNSCLGGDLGTTVNESVPAAMFTSSISQADADAQAQAYAQSLANAAGSCTVPVAIVVNAGNIAVVFQVGTTTVSSATWGIGKGTMNEAQGTYNIQVIMTDGQSHNVTLSSNGTQSGTNVTFSNVSLQTPITITVN